MDTWVLPREGVARSAFRIVGNGTDRLSLGKEAHRAVARAVRRLLCGRTLAGYWQGQAAANVPSDCQMALLLRFVDRHEEPVAVRLAESLLDGQLPGGGWSRCKGEEFDIDASVLAYLVLKLYGVDPACGAMHRARRAVRAAGGADASNGQTRFFLALFGQIPYRVCPQFHAGQIVACLKAPNAVLDECSAALLGALALVRAFQPVARTGARAGVRELFIEPPERWRPLGPASCLDRGPSQRRAEQVFSDRPSPHQTVLSPEAVELVRQFLRQYCQFGADLDMASAVWGVVALDAADCSHSQAAARCTIRRLETWIGEDPAAGGIHVRPPKAASADTALALRALAAGGAGITDSVIRRAVQWLLNWSAGQGFPANRNVSAQDAPSAAFPALAGGFSVIQPRDGEPARCESQDKRLPGIPISLALLAVADQLETEEHRELPSGPLGCSATLAAADCLGQGETSLRERFDQLAARLRRAWFRCQNNNGGWMPVSGMWHGSPWRKWFTWLKGQDAELGDPATTALVLECLGRIGLRAGDRAVDRAIDCLRRLQQADGCWTGDTAAHTLPTTGQVLRAMRAVGASEDNGVYAAGINWLAASALPEGGWGCAPGLDPGETPRISSASVVPTAYGVLVLSEAGLADRPAVIDGVDFLLQEQRPEGIWIDSTGWPYPPVASPHYVATFLAVTALAAWARCLPESPGGRTTLGDQPAGERRLCPHLRLALVGEPDQPGRMAARLSAA